MVEGKNKILESDQRKGQKIEQKMMWTSGNAGTGSTERKEVRERKEK